MLKNILLTNEYYYPRGGGIEQYIQGLAFYLTSKGVKVTILTQKCAGEIAFRKAEEANIHYSELFTGSMKEPFKVMKRYREIAAFIKDGGYDLVYSNNHNSLAVIKACKSIGVPVIYGCHGIGLLCPQKCRFLKPNEDLCYSNVNYSSCLNCFFIGRKTLIKKLKYFARLPEMFYLINKYKNNKELIAQADGIITVSALIGNFFNPHENLYAVNLGIDTELFKPKHNEKILSKFNINTEYILCTSRIHNTKGQLYAVQALKNLPKNIKIVLVGNASLFEGKKDEYGEYGSVIKRYIEENNMRDRVIFTGFLNTEDLVILYSRARITIVPSIWFDPCPTVTIESLSCGTPVIITSNSGSSELVSPDIGRIIPRKDSNAIAKAVLEIWNIADEMGKKGRERMKSEQSWDIIGRKTLNIFNEVKNNINR